MDTNTSVHVCRCVREEHACLCRTGRWGGPTFALSQHPIFLQTLELAGAPSVPLVIGCAVSCMALLTLLAIYAAFWR